MAQILENSPTFQEKLRENKFLYEKMNSCEYTQIKDLFKNFHEKLPKNSVSQPFFGLN